MVGATPVRRLRQIGPSTWCHRALRPRNHPDPAGARGEGVGAALTRPSAPFGRSVALAREH